jgi:hypothetical protein
MRFLFQVPRARAILKEVTEAVNSWPEFARKAEVSPDIAEGIRQDHLGRRVLVDRSVSAA